MTVIKKPAVYIRSIALSVCVAGAAYARDAAFENAPYMNPSLSVDERLNDLISRMTIEEKIAAVSTMKGFDAYEIRDGKEQYHVNIRSPAYSQKDICDTSEVSMKYRRTPNERCFNRRTDAYG